MYGGEFEKGIGVWVDGCILFVFTYGQERGLYLYCIFEVACRSRLRKHVVLAEEERRRQTRGTGTMNLTASSAGI